MINLIPGDWTDVAFWALIIAIIVGFGVVIWSQRNEFRPRKRKVSREWVLTDYSHQYRAKREFLGDRYLLAKPINRRAS